MADLDLFLAFHGFSNAFPQTVFRRVCLPGNSILAGTGYNL
jgi:hypothetical protein